MISAVIPGIQELLIILIIILVLTGGAFLPRMMRNMGKKMKDFEEHTKDPDDKINDTINDILNKEKKE